MVIANYGVTTHELRELREPHEYPITKSTWQSYLVVKRVE